MAGSPWMGAAASGVQHPSPPLADPAQVPSLEQEQEEQELTGGGVESSWQLCSCGP